MALIHRDHVRIAGWNALEIKRPAGGSRYQAIKQSNPIAATKSPHKSTKTTATENHTPFDRSPHSRPDVFLSDDYGVRNGWRIAKKLDEMPKPKDFRVLAERWQPHRTLAAWYLWRAADAGK